MQPKKKTSRKQNNLETPMVHRKKILRENKETKHSRKAQKRKKNTTEEDEGRQTENQPPPGKRTQKNRRRKTTCKKDAGRQTRPSEKDIQKQESRAGNSPGCYCDIPDESEEEQKESTTQPVGIPRTECRTAACGGRKTRPRRRTAQ